jgi:hypothetical protein
MPWTKQALPEAISPEGSPHGRLSTDVLSGKTIAARSAVRIAEALGVAVEELRDGLPYPFSQR